jgi:hypothetical protein
MIATTAKLAGLLSATSLLLTPAAFAARSAHMNHSEAGTWSFPSCSIVRTPDYEYIYSGDPCVASPAVVAPAAATPSGPIAGFSTPSVGAWRFPGCADNVEYDYVFSGCQL